MLAAMPQDQRKQLLKQLGEQTVAELSASWKFWARPNQLAPPGDWSTWIILAGRGFGKTRAGAEWVLDRCNELATTDPTQLHYISLLGRTPADVRAVMVEGESGLIACASRRGWETQYEPSKRKLTIWTADGRPSVAIGYTAQEPDQARGPQCHTAWIDEEAAHPDKRDAEGNTAVTNIELGMRLGSDPRAVSTTTPKATKRMRERLQEPGSVVTRGTTYDNLANLANAFKDRILRKFEGTRLGRQELHAELLDDIAGALWTVGQITEATVTEPYGALGETVVAVDPPGSAGGDEMGLVVAARAADDADSFYVLDDRSAGGLTPNQRLERVVKTALEWHATTIVVETNNGGDWLPNAIREAARQLAKTDPSCRRANGLRIKTVTATRGKQTRAEPVVSLYEQGRVRHVDRSDINRLSGLVEQMTEWVPSSGDKSPDRIDALVWAVTYLAGLNDTGPNRVKFRTWT